MQEVDLSKYYFHRINHPEAEQTIIFLHDSLGCTQLWRDFPEQFAKKGKYNVIVYDRLGYGKSAPFKNTKRGLDYMEKEADILIRLLDQWNVKKPILFGHSDGGSIALIAAGKYPNKIGAVITEGAHVFVEEITLKGIHDAMEVYSTTKLKEKLEKYHGAKTEALFQAWAHTWTQDFFKSWNIEKFLTQINCPSLIIQGHDDEYGSMKQVDAIEKQVHGPCVTLKLDKIKHSPHKEIPEVILDKSLEFLKKQYLG